MTSSITNIPPFPCRRRQKVDVYNFELKTYNLVTYTGDTCAAGLTLPSPPATNPLLASAFTSALVFCELTYITVGDAKAREIAAERKHMHIDDLEGVFGSHGWGKGLRGGAGTKVVFFHVSAKHGPSSAVLKQLKGALPAWMMGRCGIINNDWWRGHERDASVFWI